jgi:glycosyltransferase involved in cell wall biosynthesis
MLNDKRNKKRILQITANPFPPAIRVVKEGLSLVNAGYQCAVLCPPTEGKTEQEVWRGINIYRPISLKRAAKTSDKVIYLTMYFSPAWFKAIKEVITEYEPDAIHVHDIWLGRTAFWARKHQKIVMDLHENWPAAVVEYRKGFRGLFKWFYSVFHTHYRVAQYERALLAKSDKVFVVVEEALRRVLHEHPNLKCESVVNIENLESKEFLNNELEGIVTIEKNHFSILYIGGVGPHRGIDTVISAMQYIKK